MVPEWLQASMFTGVVTGLVFYGAMSVHIKWLHSKITGVETDVNILRQHLNELMLAQIRELQHAKHKV